jgi:hypothetical protein
MRDPDITFDREVEAAIEDTYRFLEPHVSRLAWAADPDRDAIKLLNAFEEIENSSLPKWVKLRVREPLVKAMRKRHGKPKRRFRDFTIAAAANRLIARGYDATRNDATRHTQSASSIVRQALRRLGVTMKEKQINTIVLKYPPD